MVYQGERAMARDNRILGAVPVDRHSTPAPRGIPQVEVTFDIDANGILNVAAKDKATNNEHEDHHHLFFGPQQGRSRQDGQGRRSHSADDKKRKDEIDARNRADSMVYQVEKMLKDHRDKINVPTPRTSKRP